MLSVSGLFLLQLILKLTLLKAQKRFNLERSRALDNTSAEIKLLANINEGATSHDTVLFL